METGLFVIAHLFLTLGECAGELLRADGNDRTKVHQRRPIGLLDHGLGFLLPTGKERRAAEQRACRDIEERVRLGRRFDSMIVAASRPNSSAVCSVFAAFMVICTYDLISLKKRLNANPPKL